MTIPDGAFSASSPRNSERPKSPNRNGLRIHAVDLFCGAGGLTHGLQKAGIEVRLGVDVDPNCEYPFTANNRARFLLKPVEKLEALEVEEYLPKGGFRLIAGCAPCQTFSTYNQKARPTDSRWWLLKHFARLICEIQPELVTMENVPPLMKRYVFDDFVRSLVKLGYRVHHEVVNAAEYGVPQHRRRLVLLASRLGQIRLLTPDEFAAPRLTVRDVIAGLPPLESGAMDDGDPLHQCSILSETNRLRIAAARPGGTWREWPEDLRARCHRQATGKTYPSVYGRMIWDEPAPTITTQFFGFGNGRFGHPEQDRAISLREGAILQSFPPDYRFVPPGEPIHKKVVGRLIGNAVPPRLGEAIGRSLIHHVESQIGLV